MSTDSASDNHRQELLVPLAAEDVAMLGSDGKQLAALLATALHGLALLRTGRATADELAAVIDGTTGLVERLEAIRDAAVRQDAARDVSISHSDLAAAMHLKSRATAQTRRRTLLSTTPGELERWATGTTG